MQLTNSHVDSAINASLMRNHLIEHLEHSHQHCIFCPPEANAVIFMELYLLCSILIVQRLLSIITKHVILFVIILPVLVRLSVYLTLG